VEGEHGQDARALVGGVACGTGVVRLLLVGRQMVPQSPVSCGLPLGRLLPAAVLPAVRAVHADNDGLPHEHDLVASRGAGQQLLHALSGNLHHLAAVKALVPRAPLGLAASWGASPEARQSFP
jgi:hypothetical protein